MTTDTADRMLTAGIHRALYLIRQNRFEDSVRALIVAADAAAHLDTELNRPLTELERRGLDRDLRRDRRR